jgi:hypothetical protein
MLSACERSKSDIEGILQPGSDFQNRYWLTVIFARYVTKLYAFQTNQATNLLAAGQT